MLHYVMTPVLLTTRRQTLHNQFNPVWDLADVGTHEVILGQPFSTMATLRWMDLTSQDSPASQL